MIIKDVREEVSEALTNIKSSISSKQIEEKRYDQRKKYSVFERVRDGSRQTLVAFMVYDLVTVRLKMLSL